MRSLCCLLVVLLPLCYGVALGQAPKGGIYSVGFLTTRDATGAWVSEPFVPQPGDIVLFDAANKLHHAFYKLANTSAPTHVAIVVAKADGSRALLDITGPICAFAKVEVVEIGSRMSSYKGSMMVRRVKQPLTSEQCQRLVEFAYAQDGKRFALGRVILQVTPFCPRDGIRHALFARTAIDRNRWFCSELVIAACTVSGLLESGVCSANATYPRDLAFDERTDFSPYFHPLATWTSEVLAGPAEKRVVIE